MLHGNQCFLCSPCRVGMQKLGFATTLARERKKMPDRTLQTGYVRRDGGPKPFERMLKDLILP